MTQNRVTIRNIDLEILAEAREIVRSNEGVTLGSFFSDALAMYIETLPEFEDEE